jgi:glycosyltransferase-like protein LARGE
MLFHGLLDGHQSVVDPTLSVIQSSTIQIVPRLLPNHHTNSKSLDQLKIRKNLKGTSVNTDEVIAEDDASLWTTKTGKVTLRVTSPTSFRRTADGRPIPPRSTIKGFDPSLSDRVDWYPVGHNLSGRASASDVLLQSARKEIHSTTEDFFLSKAFSDSLGPSKIIPFFYKALGPDQSGTIDAKDISITTLVTSNRFKVFAKLVENYQGPISATIHVSDSPVILKPLLESLDELYRSSKSMSTWVVSQPLQD